MVEGFAPTPAIDSARYRLVLGHFATGVTVVAAILDAEPRGLAVNSFTSVSLVPPLVAFCVSKDSATWPAIRESGAFCVSILADDQEEISRRFAAQELDRFQGIGWKPSDTGAPLISDALAWIDCTVEAEHDGGDHLLVLGRVRDLGVGRKRGPLIFYRGGYGRFQP